MTGAEGTLREEPAEAARMPPLATQPPDSARLLPAISRDSGAATEVERPAGFSTVDQKPDLQYDGLRTYAAQAGLDVVKDYLDVGVSGARRDALSSTPR